MGIVTNKPLRFAEPILINELAFKNCKTLICPDHLDAIKPDPEGILKGCKDLGIHPTECIYVGDHAKRPRSRNKRGDTMLLLVILDIRLKLVIVRTYSGANHQVNYIN